VCANTLAMAHDDKASSYIRIMHSKNVNQNLDKVQEIVNASNARFEATAEQYKALARSKVNQNDLQKYVYDVFKIDEQDERKELARKRHLEDITRLFETGYGSNLKSAKGTYWGLYNAVTQYLSYERGTEEHRLNQVWFGDGANINKQALKVALEAV
jgi:phage/plasmid-like protein (TIGR03299 family)